MSIKVWTSDIELIKVIWNCFAWEKKKKSYKIVVSYENKEILQVSIWIIFSTQSKINCKVFEQIKASKTKFSLVSAAPEFNFNDMDLTTF